MAVTLVRDLIIDRGNLRGESNFLISPLSYRRHFPFESVAIAAPLFSLSLFSLFLEARNKLLGRAKVIINRPCNR